MTDLDPLAALQSSERLSGGLTTEYLEHHAIMPISRNGERLLTATWADSVDERALDDLRLMAGR